jgi:uncharacterized protein YqfA (UPF0365 family)
VAQFSVFGFGAVVVGVLVVMYMVPFRLWVSALAAGAGVSMLQLIGMRLRRVPPERIVIPRISAVKAGINISIDQLEAHFLAGGNVALVINALISADKAGIDLDFQRASAIDLAGRNVLEAVQMSVNPKVITTPNIIAVAKDGIQLMAIARITVRANIERLVGGAGEETVIARVGEGVVSTIGGAHDHKEVLEFPNRISKNVLHKGLDSGTAFEILSIDIMDVNIGENIGAKLNIDKANADKQVAQALAESRRAMAVAAEQEMKARLQEMKAKLVESEAQIPMAMAEALRGGRLGVMDYYNMKNVAADTEMRQGIATMGGGGPQRGGPSDA